MTKEGSPKEILTRETVRQLRSDIWENQYLQDKYGEASSRYELLYSQALEQHIDSEDIAGVAADWAWSEYREIYVRKKVKDTPDKSKVIAQKGLDLLTNPNTVHETRARLLEVAGLSAINILGQENEAEPLLAQAEEEAEKSGSVSLIGETANGRGLFYFGVARRRSSAEDKKQNYERAIPFFEKAARIHEEAKTQGRTAGHPHNNLAECYVGVGEYEKANRSADKAIEKYPELSDDWFSARHKKSLALRGLGRPEDALIIYELHKHLRAQDPKLSEQKKAELIANEDKNIEATREQIKE